MEEQTINKLDHLQYGKVLYSIDVSEELKDDELDENSSNVLKTSVISKKINKIAGDLEQTNEKLTEVEEKIPEISVQTSWDTGNEKTYIYSKKWVAGENNDKCVLAEGTYIGQHDHKLKMRNKFWGHNNSECTWWGEVVPVATQTCDGAMSATDKAKLDSVKNFIFSGSDFDVDDQGNVSLYKAMSISSFSGGGNYEKGQEITSISFSWVTNKIPTSLKITSTGYDSGELTGSSKTITGSWTTTTTFTLTAIDAKQVSSTKTTALSFLSKKYYGVSSKSTLTNTEVLGLATQPLTSNNGTATPETEFDCTGGKYPWFCIPSSWTAPKFYVGGLPNSDFVSSTLSLTNGHGYTENYTLWRTTGIQTGKLKIQVKTT